MLYITIQTKNENKSAKEKERPPNKTFKIPGGSLKRNLGDLSREKPEINHKTETMVEILQEKEKCFFSLILLTSF